MNVSGLFGMEHPVVQAPMAGVQDHALAVAVCNAGGLGSLPCALLDAEALRREVTAIRRRTSGPYNLNFFCHVPPQPDAGKERAWRRALAPYYAEFGIDPDVLPPLPDPPGSGRRPFNAEMADLLEEFRPPVLSFHFGLPEPGLLQRVRSWGSKILSTATTVEEALWLESRGVDAIIAQGLEAGGHRGHFLSGDLDRQAGTLTLVRQVVQAVDLPVIAAGGIADAAGVAAAMTLGAAGAQVGTAYLLCPEASTSAVHRAALQSESARHTALTNLYTGRPARAIVNRLMRELGPSNPIAPDFPTAAVAIGPLRAHAERAGSGAFSPLWAGQNATACRDVPAAELTRSLAGAFEGID